MTNKRFGKVVKLGRSMAVVLPRDWTRGNDLAPGDEIEIWYDGEVRVRPKKEPEVAVLRNVKTREDA